VIDPGGIGDPECPHINVDRGVYEFCEDCGAVRRSKKPGTPQDPWHSCPRCKRTCCEVENG
jgi:hypothetical protein